MSTRNLQRPPAGISLIEVMVATALLLVSIFGLVAVFPMQRKAVVMSHDVLAATALAEREMERTLALGYSGASSRTVGEEVRGTVDGTPVTVSLTCRTTVTAVSSQLKDVVVEVSWQEGGRTHALSLETLLAAAS